MKFTILLSLILLFSFSLSTYFLLSANPSSPEEICVCNGNQGDPRVYGNLVVWEDWRDGNGDIYLYDLEKREERALCAEPGNQTFPDIWGDIVVWYDERREGEGAGMFWPVSIMNVTTGEKWKVPVYDTGVKPRIYKDIVIFHASWYSAPGWDKNYNCGFGICNLTSGRKTIIPTGSFIKDFFFIQDLDIYGKNIVYSTGFGIYIYDLEGRKETTIREKEGIMDVEIWEDRVVWIEGSGDEERAVWLLDLKSGEKRQITQSKKPKGSLDLKGDKMVWCEWDKKPQMVIYDLEKQSVTRIERDRWIYGPSISEDYVVWMEFKDWKESIEKGEFVGSGWDIYGCKI